jgi:hypothetical protein
VRLRENLRANARKALGIALLAAVQHAWSGLFLRFHWADFLGRLVLFFVLWLTGATVRDRWRGRQARRAAAAKAGAADLTAGFGE